MMRSFTRFVGDYFPVLAICMATLWASITIALRRAEEAPVGVRVIRVGHWQLEAGVRDAIEAAAVSYQKLHPDVKIVQDAIPDQVFAQWATTQLIGGTAPDLIEAGGQMSPPLWLNLQRRYLLPLTEYYAKPNPYNRGTNLEGVPLAQTFRAGNTVIPELQENMDISLSRLSIRVFYNKNLLRELTGLETPPQDFVSFTALCKKISSQNYTPIVGSNYHFGMWNQVFDALTYPATRKADFNRDGYVGVEEMYIAFQQGRLDFTFPALRAKFAMIQDLSQYFQPGFTGLTREEGLLLFAQKKAVFMSTGLWEARGVFDLAKGKFEVGVMNFPEPTQNDSRYGKYLEGPIYEEPRNSLGFSVSRASKHPELAIDFLLFMASQKENEKINQIIGWIPNVVGAKADRELAVFEPNLMGAYPSMDFNLNGDTMIRWKQLFDLFSVNQITYDQLAADYSSYYRQRGAIGFQEMRDNWQRSILQNEQMRILLRAQAFNAPADKKDESWIKYSAFTSDGQARTLIGQAYLTNISEGKIPLHPPSDTYRPEVLKRIRENLKP